jgi:hypothetical protein
MVVGRPVDGLLCWIALAAFQLANRWLLFKIYRAVDSVMPISARPLPFQSLNWMGQIALITATQLTHIGAAISVLLKKSVRWRGIDYRVAAPFRIDMARYQPIRDTTSFKPGADRATESIV